LSWSDPGLPLWAIIVGLLCVLNGAGLLVSLAIHRWGLPQGWSVQSARRKKGLLRRHMPLIAGNLAVMTIGAAIAFYLFEDSFVFEKPTWTAASAVFFGLVLFDDFGFYWVHRTLHTNRALYRRFHRQHHQAYAPVPIEYIHAHPVEWMSGATLPVMFFVGVIWFTGTMNAWVLIAWVTFRQVHEMDIHSGTESMVGKLIPFYGTCGQHDLHHARPRSGNYASTLAIWDRVFGTHLPNAGVRRSKAS
jgi:sterol desaturase/sphingolipid hydroxylase (fatty acid hydroxylase superfamily)